KLPSQPWVLAPGDHGKIPVTVDLRGKRGTLNKFLSVDSSAGIKMLTLKVIIPDTPGMNNSPDSRGRNLMVALADRQAVFRNDCASCHAAPTHGQMGAALYQAACAI